MKKNNGYTLIEIIVTVGLLSIVLLPVSIFLSRGFSSYNYQSQEVEQQEKIASILTDFEKTTRAATEVLIAEQSQLKFYRYFDLTSSAPTQVRYFVDGDSLKVGITEPQGTAPNVTYPPGLENVRLIITNVTNPTNIFKYYNGANTEMSFPVNLANVRMVMVTLSLDQDTTKPPPMVTESTKVSLRNMKDNL